MSQPEAFVCSATTEASDCTRCVDHAGSTEPCRPFEPIGSEVGHDHRSRSLQLRDQLQESSHESRTYDHYVVAQRWSRELDCIYDARKRFAHCGVGDRLADRDTVIGLCCYLLGEAAALDPCRYAFADVGARYRGAASDDLARDFVADGDRERLVAPAAPKVDVGGTHPALLDLDKHLVGSGGRTWDFA